MRTVVLDAALVSVVRSRRAVPPWGLIAAWACFESDPWSRFVGPWHESFDPCCCCCCAHIVLARPHGRLDAPIDALRLEAPFYGIGPNVTSGSREFEHPSWSFGSSIRPKCRDRWAIRNLGNTFWTGGLVSAGKDRCHYDCYWML